MKKILLLPFMVLGLIACVEEKASNKILSEGLDTLPTESVENILDNLSQEADNEACVDYARKTNDEKSMLWWCKQGKWEELEVCAEGYEASLEHGMCLHVERCESGDKRVNMRNNSLEVCLDSRWVQNRVCEVGSMPTLDVLNGCKPAVCSYGALKADEVNNRLLVCEGDTWSSHTECGDTRYAIADSKSGSCVPADCSGAGKETDTITNTVYSCEAGKWQRLGAACTAEFEPYVVNGISCVECVNGIVTHINLDISNACR